MGNITISPPVKGSKNFVSKRAEKLLDLEVVGEYNVIHIQLDT